MIIEKDTDPNFNHLQDIMKYIDGHIVKAGYIENKSKNKRKKGKADNVLLATVHNLGSPKRKIPARPTMAPAFDKNQETYNKMTDNAIYNTISQKNKRTFDQQFGQVGIKMQNDIQQEIRTIEKPKLKQATIKRKGSSKPLIDGGEYIQATTFVTGKNI